MAITNYFIVRERRVMPKESILTKVEKWKSTFFLTVYSDINSI